MIDSELRSLNKKEQMTNGTNFFKSCLASLWGGITCLTPVARASEFPAAQTAPPPISDLAQQVVTDLTQCLFENISNPQQANQQQLEAVAIRCFYQVIIIAPEGGIRTDAEARLKSIVTLSGVALPKKVSQGEASLQLKSLSDTGVFTIPVMIEGQSQDFLFDTGASNSVVDSGLAEKLGLDSTPIPNDVLEYMVVGESCADITASINTLPPLGVERATVEGIISVGLPKENIPGSVAGVLGLDFLSNFDLNFNPQTQTLKLLAPSTAQAKGISLQGKMGLMIAQVRINGEGPYNFLLDTGTEWVAISEDLAQKLALTTQASEQVEVSGFCGTEKGEKVILKQVAIQAHQQQNLEAVVLKSEVLKFLGIDGIIGQNFLNQYQQYWQFSPPNELGFPDGGSLLLKPIN